MSETVIRLKKSQVKMTIILFLLSIIINIFLYFMFINSLPKSLHKEPTSLQIVSQHKFGDDVNPKVALTYCQILPFKRFVGDDQVYCFTEIEEMKHE